MADILNSAILDSAILKKKNHFTHSFWLNLKMAAILKSTNLDSANLHKKTSLIHSDSSWWWQPSWILPSWILSSWIQSFWTIKNFTHSLSPNLMMAAILNSAMLDSATAILDSNTLLSSLRFTQKHSHSNLTLTQTNSIWLKLIHSHLTSWWQPCWIVPSLIQPFWTKKILHSFLLTQLDDVRPSWILPSWILSYWIQPFWTKKKLHSFILTHLDDGSHLEFYLLGISHFEQKTSLIHSDSTWWWQPSWILPCWIQPLPSWIQTPCYLLSDSLKNSLTPLWLWLKLIQSDSKTHSFWLNLMTVSHLEFLPSWILPSWIQPS